MPGSQTQTQYEPPISPEPEETQDVQQSGPSGSNRRRLLNTWLIRIAKTGITVTLLYLLMRTISRDALLQAISSTRPFPVILAVLLVPVNLFLQSTRWYMLVSTEFSSLSYKRVFASFLGGLSLGMITPGRVGEVGRIFLLDVPSRIRLVGLHVLDKMYFAGAVGLMGPAMLYMMPGFSDALPDALHAGTVVLVAILPFFYLLFALSPKPLKALLLSLQLMIGAKGRTLELLRAYEGIKPKHCAWLTGITVTQILVILTQFFLLSLSLESVSWLTAAHTYAAALFVKTTLPVSLGSLGVGEWAAVSFYARYGIADTTGFSASLMLFAMNVLLPSILGLWVLFRMRPQALLRRLGLSKGDA